MRLRQRTAGTKPQARSRITNGTQLYNRPRQLLNDSRKAAGEPRIWGELVSFAFRNPLQAVFSQDDATQDFLRVADILEPGLNAGWNAMSGRMRRELP